MVMGTVGSDSWGQPCDTLRVWDLATGECILIYGMEYAIFSAAVHGAGLVAGESTGRVDMLTIGNYRPGIPVITAAWLWLSPPTPAASRSSSTRSSATPATG